MIKICVFTGSRAEYGLLKPLLNELKKDRTVQLQVLASGAHLSPEFGLTCREIESDGFAIDEKVEMLLSSDTTTGVTKSIGLGLIGISDALNRLKPDISVVLGDRYEALAFAVACTVFRIPLGHIHGGEVTEGAIDDSFRHSITKMSHLHFTSTEEYRRRVIQLGETPARVFNVGALGIDNIRKLKLLSKKELEKEIGFSFNSRNLLVTFHPVTLEKNTTGRHFGILLDALAELENTNFIFTKANADADGRVVNEMIDKHLSANAGRSVAFASMGQVRYLSAMKYVDAVVGNSSSGIIEAPSFRIGTINIGDRQRGRIRTGSIIDCKPVRNDIRRALKKLYSDEFKEGLKDVINPYGDGNTAVQIATTLRNYDLNSILKKRFFDMNFENKR
jgi:GDP/UDP-N,N'-diacetylbacillosamine 2-epimerase (hydrolysing)